jgi:hypothetical protein
MIASSYQGRKDVHFASVDCDKEKKLCNDVRIDGFPTVRHELLVSLLMLCRATDMPTSCSREFSRVRSSKARG